MSEKKEEEIYEGLNLTKDVLLLIIIILVFYGILASNLFEGLGGLLIVPPFFLAIVYKVGTIAEKITHHIVLSRIKKDRDLRPEDKKFANEVWKKVFIVLIIAFFLFFLINFLTSPHRG